jgi:hypothetical protein
LKDALHGVKVFLRQLVDFAEIFHQIVLMIKIIFRREGIKRVDVFVPQEKDCFLVDISVVFVLKVLLDLRCDFSEGEDLKLSFP